jgi:hypothetical protein
MIHTEAMVVSTMLSLIVVAWSGTPSPPVSGVSWVEAVGAAERMPGGIAADAGAHALRDAAARMGPLDALRAELQPGAQFHPFNALTSPAGQLVIEATSGSAVLFGSRAAHARSAADVLGADADALRLQRRVELSEAWCDRHAAELSEAAARVALDDARALLGRLERLHEQPAAGLLFTVDDLVAVRALVAEAALAVLDAEAARLEAGLRLGRHIGVAHEVKTAGPLPDAREVPARDEPHASEGPEVARAEATLVAARAALVAFERELGPTVGLGMQAQLDDGDTGFAYGRVTVSLPRVDGDPRGRAELVAIVQLAEAALIEQRRARTERLSIAHHEVEHQHHTLSLVEEGLLPVVIERRRIAEKRHALGAAELFELVAATRAEHEARRRLALARVELARARVTLAMLDPAHLDDPGPAGHESHAGHHDDDVLPSGAGMKEPR